MSDVQLDDEEIMIKQSTSIGNLADNRSVLVKMVMGLKLAKTEAQADYVLIIIMVAAFVATFFVISRYLI